MKIINPVIRGFNPDPSLLRVDDDYYIANSTFHWFPGVQIHHSKDLINWELIEKPLDSKRLLDMTGVPDSGGVWAPDLTYADGKFWLVYSNVKSMRGAFKDTPNFLTTAENIHGPWSDPIYLNSNGFDASLFHAPDGKKYLINMVWDQRNYHHQFNGIQLREYSVAEEKLVGEPHIIWNGTADKITEGPHLYYINNYYYLFCAQGGTNWPHQEVVARATDLLGDYEVEPGEALLTAMDASHNYLQKCGHGSLIETPDHEWYLAHLMARPLHHPNESVIEPRGWAPLGRETSIQKIEWDEAGWPHVVGGKAGSREVAAPRSVTTAGTPINNMLKTDFDDDQLDINLNTLRLPKEELGVSLTDRPGYLRLYGRESLSSLFNVALVAHRWQAFDFEAVTKVAYRPTNYQQMAGVVNYYDTTNYTAAYITYNEVQGRCIEVLSCDAENFTFYLKDNAIQIPDDVTAVYLKTAVRHENYTYAYSFDGQKWQTIPVTFDSLKLSDDYILMNYGGYAFFTGAFTGVFSSDLTGSQLPADFDYFEYQEQTE